MTLTINPTTQAEAAASQAKPILLFEFYLTAGTQFFTTCDHLVSQGGNTYYPFPLGISEITKSSVGLSDSVTIVLSNVSREISTLLLSESFRGKRVIIRRTFLLADNTVAPPFIAFDGLMDVVIGKEEKDTAIIQATCTTDLAYWQKSIPGRQFQATCQNEFKDSDCLYAGVETSCNRTWDRCVALSNTNNYTGFRHLPQLENTQIWWGKANPAPSASAVNPPVRVW